MSTPRVIAKAANYTIVAPAGTPQLFTNRGALGAITFTLPWANAGLIGTEYRFRAVAAFPLTVQVPGGAAYVVPVGSAAVALCLDTGWVFDGAATAAAGTFLQTGAGAVSRLITDRLREVVSAKDFGAVGNGVADDAPALQAAIDAAKVRGVATRVDADPTVAFDHMGVPVFLPAGLYLINAPLIFPRTFQHRSRTAGLVGEYAPSTQIQAGPTFPVNRALIEWETPGGLVTDVRDFTLTNLTLRPKNAVGSKAIWFKLTNPQASYGLDMNAIDTIYNARFENLIVYGHNTYHESVCRFEGRVDSSFFVNICGDFNLGTAFSTRLLQFDDLSTWPLFAPDEYNRGQDLPGFNFGTIDTLSCGFRGGRVTYFYGRAGFCSTIRALVGGLGAVGQAPSFYFRDSAAVTIQDVSAEGFGENGILTFENCNDIIVTNMVLGRTDEATALLPGSALRFINCKDLVLNGKWSAPAIPPYSANFSKLVRIDATCTRLTFQRFKGTASFAEEWDIDPAATAIRVEYLDVNSGIQTVIP